MSTNDFLRSLGALAADATEVSLLVFPPSRGTYGLLRDEPAGGRQIASAAIDAELADRRG